MTTPKDYQVITAILKDMAIANYDQRVVHQLIGFAYSKSSFKLICNFISNIDHYKYRYFVYLALCQEFELLLY